MTRQVPYLRPISIVFLTAAILGMVWANYQFASNHSGGRDFAIYWSSGRTVLLDNATPYGELALSRSQNLIYGTAGSRSLPPALLDLPFHIAPFFLPFSLISDFTLARALWMTLLEVSLILTVLVVLRTVHWSPKPAVGGIILLFALFSVYGLWALIQGNAIILAGFFMSGALLALKEDHDDLAGILLGLATFKFLSIGVLLLFILFWCAFQKRKRVFIPFIMTFIILIALSFFFYPNWFVSYFRAVYATITYGGWISPAVYLQNSLPYFGNKLGWMFSGILAVVLIVEWWLSVKKDFPSMLWTAALTLSLTPLIGLPVFPQNFVILIFCVIFALSVLSKRRTTSSDILIVGLVLFLFVFSWGITVYSTNKLSALYWSYPIFLIVFLYWIRWWAVSKTRSRVEINS